MKSKDERVQKFLEELEGADLDKYQILQEARGLVFKTHPEISERIMYGGIMFTLQDDFGGLYPSKKHVSFEFSQGFAFEDPKGILEGTGKFRRHLKLVSVNDIETKQLLSFLKQL